MSAARDERQRLRRTWAATRAAATEGLEEAVNDPVIRAAGGVLWRRAAGAGAEPGVEVAIVHRPRYDDWSLPKGKLAPGEAEVEGAVREVLEETGYRVRIGGRWASPDT